jgi:hypothetical protein
MGRRHGVRIGTVLFGRLDETTGIGVSRDGHIYGACCGGTLVDDSLRVAMPSGEKLFWIYHLHELVEQVEVKRAMALDP